MAKKVVYLEKSDDTPGRHPSVYFDQPALRGFWRGHLEGARFRYETGLVGKPARPAVERSFAAEDEAARAFDQLVEVQRKKGFEPVAQAPTSKPRSARRARLAFHQRVCDALDFVPARSKQRAAALEKREAASGVTFPASVKEWFGLEGVHELFREHTNEDALVALDELGGREEARQGYLRVAIENQAVVSWFVRLDGTDDPPVLAADVGEDESSALDEVAWTPCADTFSEFLRDMLLR